jgi:hypothetical protein
MVDLKPELQVLLGLKLLLTLERRFAMQLAELVVAHAPQQPELGIPGLVALVVAKKLRQQLKPLM